MLNMDAGVEERAVELRRVYSEIEGFEYAIAHELRAPLRGIASTASILSEELGPGLCAAHRSLLDRQVQAATRFGHLIDDLLAYSRLARVEVASTMVDLTDLVRGLSFDGVEVQDGLVVWADPRLLQVALRCLLDNARKFSVGTIEVRFEEGVLSVSDRGIGFDPRHAVRIFRPFERLVGEEVPGTGIGLALVERIAGRHGGRVWATSALARGATFSMTLANRPASSL